MGFATKAPRSIMAAAIVAAALAACTPTAEHLAVLANSPGTIATGEQRVLIGYLSEDGAFLAREELRVEADFFFGDEEEPRQTAVGTFHPTIPGARGIYRFTVDFEDAGTWRAILRPEGAGPTPATSFQVFLDTTTPGPGDAAPRSASITSADASLVDITTDPNPEPAFYQRSIAEAVTSGSPSVIVFATPAFCTTATCGPTLDVVKEVAAAYPTVLFVHVEVFEDLDATTFEDLAVVPAVAEWSLPSEPWVFVIDAQGVIASAFEGTVASDELTSALDGVTQ